MSATPAWPPKSAPRLFVEPLLSEGLRLSIEGQQAHYLGKVMRAAPGDAVIVCDDVTGEWVARVSEAGKRAVVLEIEHRLREREDVPDFWLCAALLKKPNFDLVLEKATELGVAKVVPLVTRRCVADKLNPERARTIVTEAAEQCARTALPALGETAKARPVAARLARGTHAVLCRRERGDARRDCIFSAWLGTCGAADRAGGRIRRRRTGRDTGTSGCDRDRTGAAHPAGRNSSDCGNRAVDGDAGRLGRLNRRFCKGESRENATIALV